MSIAKPSARELADILMLMKRNAHGLIVLALTTKERDLIAAALRSPQAGADGPQQPPAAEPVAWQYRACITGVWGEWLGGARNDD